MTERQLRARFEHVAPPDVAPEPGQLDRDRVGARLDGAERELAAVIADRGPAVQCAFIGERHGGAGKYLVGRVDDRPGDDAGVLRGGDERRDEKRRDRAGRERGRKPHAKGPQHHESLLQKAPV